MGNVVNILRHRAFCLECGESLISGRYYFETHRYALLCSAVCRDHYQETKQVQIHIVDEEISEEESWD